MNTRIISNLQSFEISHSFALNYNHGIQLNDKWDLFEPTRFVYAFFAFNMIYAIDWSNSMKNNRIVYQRKGDDNHAKDQMQSLIEFVHDYDSMAFQNALEDLDNKRELFAIVSQMETDYNSSRKSSRNTGNTISQDFLLASKKFDDGVILLPNDQFDLLQMSYTVRNNLFHGEKKAHQMKEKGHRKRLLHYGNIILATNESFFEVMKNNFGYRRMENWEIRENF